MNISRAILYFCLFAVFSKKSCSGDFGGELAIEAGSQIDFAVIAGWTNYDDGFSWKPQLAFPTVQLNGREFMYSFEGLGSIGAFLLFSEIADIIPKNDTVTIKVIKRSGEIFALLPSFDADYRIGRHTFGVSHRFRWLNFSEITDRVGVIWKCNNDKLMFDVNPYYSFSSIPKLQGFGISLMIGGVDQIHTL